MMARITIRDLPEAVYETLASASVSNHRSLEGESRYALQQYVLSLKTASSPCKNNGRDWQEQVGERLTKLFDYLGKNRLFTSGKCLDVPHIARSLGEDSPIQLFSCMQGLTAPSFDLLNRIASWSSCSESWLISGRSSMYRMENLGSNYEEFFLKDADNPNVQLYLCRLTGEPYEGTLICIRYDKTVKKYEAGYFSETFQLKEGLGSGGHGNLRRFIIFLKKHCSNRPIQAGIYETSAEAVWGETHPMNYIYSSVRAQWLTQLFNGEDPANWLKGYASSWKEVADLHFGSNLAEM